MIKKSILAVCALAACIVGCKRNMPEANSALDAYLVLTEANFDAQVLNSSRLVLVDFYATWCGPCRQMAPVVKEVADEYQGRAVVGKLDVDENQLLAERYAIQFLPTFVLFSDGEEVARQVGGTSKQRLVSMLDAAAAAHSVGQIE